ncbi:cytochrome c oxidase subunit 3 [Bradyrhizobium sp. SYSU BS000235]|uniref:cytochrome c oxidase subunit 3 n=1 Tax=Bradyrhizobium sp. SYSU BS000235 TaxID=3411332 RepID=UPI003C70EA5A
MSAVVLFMAGVALIAGWWLSQQRLASKPWLEEGVIGDLPDRSAPLPAAKIGLGVFLAVVGSLFALLISAYGMRMDLIDWRPLPVPKLLWFNTGVLILSSIALHWALVSARRGFDDSTLLGLIAADITAIVFLIGQALVCWELVKAGYFLASNPANAFFYLITATHGLHILGGLLVLSRTLTRAWRDGATPQLCLSIELCAIYWHFLLLIWLVLLGLLTGWTAGFLAICRQLLT